MLNRMNTITLLAISLMGCGESEAPKEAVAVDICTPAQKTEEDAKAKTETKAKVQRVVPAVPANVDDADYKTLDGDLKIADLIEGTGEAAKTDDIVLVEYAGFLTDGKSFDSSCKRPEGFTFKIGAGSVIKGWEQGVVGMKPGSVRQLVIPADLGYGARDRPSIPANSTLVFDVQLVKIMPPRIAPEQPQTIPEDKLTTTESGLQYHDFVVGDGASPKSGELVKVDYTGWLQNGTKFDSSLDRPKAISFPIDTGRVIPGWDEGLLSMKVGGKRQLIIPAAIGYGEQGRPPRIPPNSTLVFEVELLDTAPAPAPAPAGHSRTLTPEMKAKIDAMRKAKSKTKTKTKAN